MHSSRRLSRLQISRRAALCPFRCTTSSTSYRGTTVQDIQWSVCGRFSRGTRLHPHCRSRDSRAARHRRRHIAHQLQPWSHNVCYGYRSSQERRGQATESGRHRNRRGRVQRHTPGWDAHGQERGRVATAEERFDPSGQYSKGPRHSDGSGQRREAVVGRTRTHRTNTALCRCHYIHSAICYCPSPVLTATAKA